VRSAWRDDTAVHCERSCQSAVWLVVKVGQNCWGRVATNPLLRRLFVAKREVRSSHRALWLREGVGLRHCLVRDKEDGLSRVLVVGEGGVGREGRQSAGRGGWCAVEVAACSERCQLQSLGQEKSSRIGLEHGARARAERALGRRPFISWWCSIGQSASRRDGGARSRYRHRLQVPGRKQCIPTVPVPGRHVPRK